MINHLAAVAPRALVVVMLPIAGRLYGQGQDGLMPEGGGLAPFRLEPAGKGDATARCVLELSRGTLVVPGPFLLHPGGSHGLRRAACEVTLHAHGDAWQEILQAVRQEQDVQRQQQQQQEGGAAAGSVVRDAAGGGGRGGGAGRGTEVVVVLPQPCRVTRGSDKAEAAAAAAAAAADAGAQAGTDSKVGAAAAGDGAGAGDADAPSSSGTEGGVGQCAAGSGADAGGGRGQCPSTDAPAPAPNADGPPDQQASDGGATDLPAADTDATSAAAAATADVGRGAEQSYSLPTAPTPFRLTVWEEMDSYSRVQQQVDRLRYGYGYSPFDADGRMRGRPTRPRYATTAAGRTGTAAPAWPAWLPDWLAYFGRLLQGQTTGTLYVSWRDAGFYTLFEPVKAKVAPPPAAATHGSAAREGLGLRLAATPELYWQDLKRVLFTAVQAVGTVMCPHSLIWSLLMLWPRGWWSIGAWLAAATSFLHLYLDCLWLAMMAYRRLHDDAFHYDSPTKDVLWYRSGNECLFGSSSHKKLLPPQKGDRLKEMLCVLLVGRALMGLAGRGGGWLFSARQVVALQALLQAGSFALARFFSYEAAIRMALKQWVLTEVASRATSQMLQVAASARMLHDDVHRLDLSQICCVLDELFKDDYGWIVSTDQISNTARRYLTMTLHRFQNPVAQQAQGHTAHARDVARRMSRHGAHWPSPLTVPMEAHDWEDVPHAFQCSITQHIMVQPALLFSPGLKSVSTYEREAIEQWLKVQRRDPRTNSALREYLLMPNGDLRRAIEEWLTARLGANSARGAREAAAGSDTAGVAAAAIMSIGIEGCGDDGEEGPASPAATPVAATPVAEVLLVASFAGPSAGEGQPLPAGEGQLPPASEGQVLPAGEAQPPPAADGARMRAAPAQSGSEGGASPSRSSSRRRRAGGNSSGNARPEAQGLGAADAAGAAAGSS